MGRCAGEIGAAIAAGRENDLVGAEAMQRAVLHRQRDDAAAAALVVHDEVDGEILDEELGRVAQRLAVHGVQHGVAGAVGGGASALGLALPKSVVMPPKPRWRILPSSVREKGTPQCSSS